VLRAAELRCTELLRRRWTRTVSGGEAKGAGTGGQRPRREGARLVGECKLTSALCVVACCPRPVLRCSCPVLSSAVLFRFSFGAAVLSGLLPQWDEASQRHRKARKTEGRATLAEHTACVESVHASLPRLSGRRSLLGRRGGRDRKDVTATARCSVLRRAAVCPCIVGGGQKETSSGA
jgi:hypothetical protein